MHQNLQVYFNSIFSQDKHVFHTRNGILASLQRQKGDFLTSVSSKTVIFGPRVGTSQEESAGTYALNLGFLHLLSSLLFFEGLGAKRWQMSILHYLKKCWLKDFHSSTIRFLYPIHILDRTQFFRVIPNNLFTVQNQCGSHQYKHLEYSHQYKHLEFSPIQAPWIFSPIQAPWIYHTDPEPGMSFPEWPKKSERHFVFSLQIKNRPGKIKNPLIRPFFVNSKSGNKPPPPPHLPNITGTYPVH